MNDIYCRLKPSNIKGAGVGVFAIENIPIGIDPFPGCETKLNNLSKEAYNNLTEDKKRMVRDFCYYSSGNWRVPNNFNQLDISWYVNSSQNPNLEFDNQTGKYKTLKEIKSGEELTYYYEVYE